MQEFEPQSLPLEGIRSISLRVRWRSAVSKSTQHPATCWMHDSASWRPFIFGMFTVGDKYVRLEIRSQPEGILVVIRGTSHESRQA